MFIISLIKTCGTRASLSADLNCERKFRQAMSTSYKCLADVLVLASAHIANIRHPKLNFIQNLHAFLLITMATRVEPEKWSTCGTPANLPNDSFKNG